MVRERSTSLPVRGLVRNRLVSAFTELPGPKRMGVVVAPAGHGKTTLLSHLATEFDGPVRWLTCERRDAEPAVLVRHLVSVLGGLAASPVDLADPDALISGLEDADHDPALLVVDDAYLLGDGPSVDLIGRLLSPTLSRLSVVCASREALPADLSRLRLSGNLVEFGAEDLRFRTWEVEALLRDVYGEPLGPEDVARLARRTQGWAACLQLFHLATRGKAVSERRAVLETLDSRSRLVREFLTRHVLDQLPPPLRAFLVRTSVLRRPTGELCDALLDRSGSIELLEELERRQLFTVRLDGDVVYRYHQVLRSYCLAELIEKEGDAAVTALYRRAGRLMEQAGDAEGAFEAYVGAGDRADALRLLGQNGGALVASATSLLDVLPQAWVNSDPWLGLAQARHLVACGRFAAAVSLYQATAAVAPPVAAALIERERRGVALWTSAGPPHPADASDWPGLLRAALQRDPLDAAERLAALPGPAARAAEAVALALGGQRSAARMALAAAVASADASAWITALGNVLASLDRALGGGPTGSVPPMMLVVDRVDAPALVRVARCLATLSDPDGDRADALVHQLRGRALREGDVWGEVLIGVIGGVGAWRRGEPAASERLAAAARRLHDLGAGVAGAWVTALAAFAAPAGSPARHQALSDARSAARAAGIPALVALLDGQRVPDDGGVSADEDRPGSGSGTSRIRSGPVAMGALGTGAGGPNPVGPSEVVPSQVGTGAVGPAAALAGATPWAPQEEEARAGTVVRCFGSFALLVDGRPVDLSALRPRTEALLRLLAAYGGRAVHRDKLCDALWPRADAGSALRNVQVAVSSLRQALPAALGRDVPGVRREGERYALDLGPDVAYDVVAFEAAVDRARAAVARAQASVALEALEEALVLQPEPLLAAAGSVDWVLDRRDRLVEDGVWAASELSRRLLELGMAAGAAETCERGLRLDRYRDELWRRLVEAADRAGNQAEAVRYRQRYQFVLSELGVEWADAEAASPA